jgi:valyl-tRNA synthetase
MTPKPVPEAPSTAYDPEKIEAKWYRYWEERGFFRAEVSNKTPHTIVMPPPNVTGRLHMGHALQDTVQDALTRMRRMQGYEALWMPGLDHAGIATQNVVERALKDTGTNRHDLGREAFVARVQAWKEEYGDIILQQKRRMGAGPDWDRTRFTMDEGFTRAVQTVFVRLYEEGLIYRGAYLVNWDPENQTALSDEEVDNVEREGSLYYVRYPLAAPEAGAEADAAPGSNAEPVDAAPHGYMLVATTRPETIMGDTAIAVNPENPATQAFIGRRAVVPFVGREIPIIADAYVKADFGAGALKVTPGHDKNDFEIGQQHGLPVVSLMNKDGTLNEEGGPYAGMERFEARKRVVADLEALGLIEKIEPYKATVPVSSRSKAVIEPLISRQWFVRMKPLAEPALAAVRDGQVTFHPARWAGEYHRWMENIRDWTISRQLWWGHRIPVWYHTTEDGAVDETRGFVVSVDRPAVPGAETMVQDEDVLDTWFSSWLWPFATLGWPEPTRDLAHFYPGTVLVSGYDILFFWIARMIMAGLHFTGEVPFRDVFITGMVKDKQGRWMSKSLGNGIDPLDMIEQYGADAVRYSLTVLCAQGQDIRLDPLKFEMGRNFANKIWNAYNVFGRFVEPDKAYVRTRSFEELTLVERWMLTRLNRTIAAVDEAVSRYRLNEALLALYELFWDDYCAWYLELIKPAPGADGQPSVMDDETIALALELYEKMMVLLHPFMPFITEELWQRMRVREDGESVCVTPWPLASPAEADDEALRVFGLVQEMISGIRAVRAEYGVAPGQEIGAVLNVPADDAALTAALERHAGYFSRLARADVEVGSGLARPDASAAVVVGRSEVFVPLAGMIDLEAERTRLSKEIQQKEGFLAGVKRKLENESFVARAPEDVVAKERQKAADAEAELERLRANLAGLG